MRAPEIFFALLVAGAAVACGSGDGGNATSSTPGGGPGDTKPGDETSTPGATDPATAEKLAEKPWEVISSHGETYLPNVFYADASQTEQIMPFAIDGHVMIDRLVYPTIGNPNLYTKSDPTDELTVVLRIEDEAYAKLGATIEPIAGSSLSRLNVKNDPKTGFAFFLIPRGSRDNNTEATTAISSGNGTGVYRVYPNDVLVNPIPSDMPDVLKQRKTLRFLFKQGAMSKVPAGLYDLRFQVTDDNKLYVPAGQSTGVYEYQYNAVRVFDDEPEEYPIINVTDTQVSVGDWYGGKTKAKLDDFVQYVNTTTDEAVKNARFITFNGDLHNGGSPFSLTQKTVATTYAEETKAILSDLKYLPVPIFLTAGNHDGYVATGQVPGAVSALPGDDLETVVTDAQSSTGIPWPNFKYSEYQAWLDKSADADALGGYHLDLFTGSFSRNAKGTGFGDGWKEVPRADRNYVLYDGFNQWQRSYGPLYYSYKFGKTFYVSMNSFELRQHRRAGWGMYTVNYGGGMSGVQIDWLDRELTRAHTDGDDVVLLAHHDPRGGHKNQDLGYLFDLLDYQSVYQSAINYLVGKVWDPAVCSLPDWSLPRSQEDSCVHDGLQEWMRPDADYDCDWSQQKPGGGCNGTLFFSGNELMSRIAKTPEVRTVLLGHTHYNSLEVVQSGDELLPGQSPITDASGQMFASLEVENPVRGYSYLSKVAKHADYKPQLLAMSVVTERNDLFGPLLDASLKRTHRVLEGAPPVGSMSQVMDASRPRELLVLRLVSNADLANQKVTTSGSSSLGFGVLHLTKKSDKRQYDRAQINQVTFYVNSGVDAFDNLRTVDLDRTARLTPHDGKNPLQSLFSW